MKRNIFYVLSICLSLSFVGTAYAQDQKPKASPAETATGMVAGADIEIHYSSPAVKGRTIWGDLVPFDSVWRAGANEATTFQTSKDILVQGTSLPAGTYAFFLLPAESGQWTAIFNKQANQWGAFEYDESQDQLRVMVTPQTLDATQERLKYNITASGFELSWEKLKIPLAITQ